MKKYIYLFLASIAMISFSSCEEDSVKALDTSFASFVSNTMDINIEAGAEISKEIKIYTTNITNFERTFNIIVSSETTIGPDSYNVPSSITVPANTNVGVITISITEIDFSDSGEKLVLRLEETSDTLTGKGVTFDIKKFCSFNINDFLGSYIITEGGYGDYGTTITLDPDVANRILVSNFWDWTNDLAYYDFNPEDGTVTMPSQVILMGDGGNYTCFGSGTYNPCTGTFHMEYGGDVAGTVHDFNPAP